MTGETISFERDIKPLFREGDRKAMSWAFDLWSRDDVSDNADRILGAIENGSMPCDAPWDAARIETYRSWIDGGKQA